MSNIHKILDHITNDFENRYVLATIVKVEGSAYRKEGTMMLISEDGKQVGVLSAGCLEEDLAANANILLKEQNIQSRMLIYDMSSEDDLSWGRGTGCNGVIHILLEKVSHKVRENLLSLKKYLEHGTSIILGKILNKDNTVAQTILLTNKNDKEKNNTELDNFFIQFDGNNKSCGIQYIEDFKANVFVQYFQPKPRLFLFGAGSDARPVASFAIQIGFSVNIWDTRPAYCTQEYFPYANLLPSTSIQETLDHLKFHPTDSVIIMTHDFQKDKELLKHLLNRKLAYLGILGPRRRTTRLLNGNEIPKQLHSPVGFAIGADGPEEIAISILAELIQIQHQYEGGKVMAIDKSRYNWYLFSCGEKQKIRGK